MRLLSRIFGKKEVTPLIPDYHVLASKVQIDDSRLLEVNKWVDFYFKNIVTYTSASILAGGFPSDLLFALHYRECSCRMDAALHNGERIIGKGTKTKLVPAGRGPFNTWESAAVDALMMKKNIFPSTWTLSDKLLFAERYNGLGYRTKIGDHGIIEWSPYVFAGTNLHDETGKYWSDGKYKADAPEAQLGVAALLKGIEARRSA